LDTYISIRTLSGHIPDRFRIDPRATYSDELLLDDLAQLKFDGGFIGRGKPMRRCFLTKQYAEPLLGPALDEMNGLPGEVQPFPNLFEGVFLAIQPIAEANHLGVPGAQLQQGCTDLDACADLLRTGDGRLGRVWDCLGLTKQVAVRERADIS